MNFIQSHFAEILFAVIVASTALIFTIITYRADANEASHFSVTDALTDSSTGKTSFMKLIVFGSWVFAWQIDLFYLLKGADVMTYTLALLGIFVTQMVLNRASEIFDPRTRVIAMNQTQPVQQ